MARGIALLAGLALSLGAAGCGDDGIRPSDLRYGQLGGIRLVLEAPLQLGVGTLKQTLEWESRGNWTVTELISYKGRPGDQDVQKSPDDPSQFAAAYAGLITQLNEVEGQKLIDFPELEPDSTVQCDSTRTRITFTIRDDARHDHTTWVACAEGSMANITTTNAGPDAASSRVAQAAMLARDYTVGESFASVYAGSVPFATLSRGQDLATGHRTSAVYTDSTDFRSFWGQAAAGRPLPAVDFSKEMVILGVVGVREEAGDSVEVRKILRVDQGTLIEVWERIPGNFCSPVAQVHVPYHVVVAPLTPSPLRFSDVRVQAVPCGG